jgi:hypothetical protein
MILPELQAKAKPIKIPVTFVDMRFSVKDENTRDNLTWITCTEQIRVYAEDSDGMSFMDLQGDKYGYIPIPKLIDKDLADTRLDKSEDDFIKSLFRKCYILDEIKTPNHYSLQPLLDTDDKDFWDIALPKLRELLDGI